MSISKLKPFWAYVVVFNLIMFGVLSSPLISMNTPILARLSYPDAKISNVQILFPPKQSTPSPTTFSAANQSTSNKLKNVSPPSNNSAITASPTKFERGNITKFSNSIYFGPYPTDDEFTVLKKNGFGVFVSLLTPKVATDVPWIKKEQAFGIKNNLTVVNFPLSPIVSQNSKADVEKVVKFVNSFRPGIKIYIHDFLGKERNQQVYQALKSPPTPVALTGGNHTGLKTQNSTNNANITGGMMCTPRYRC
jgi:hypothetical protein